MSNIVDINDLRKQFAEKITSEEWKKFAEVQQAIIEKYENQIKLLNDKNKHLESLLMSKTNIVSELTPEEVICLQQINRLEKLSTDRQLTLEEVKKLDLLVKNLKLIREESTIIVNNRNQENLKEAELVAIARTESPE